MFIKPNKATLIKISLSLILILALLFAIAFGLLKYKNENNLDQSAKTDNSKSAHLPYKEFKTDFSGEYVMENRKIPRNIREYVEELNNNGVIFRSLHPEKTLEFYLSVDADYSTADGECVVNKVYNNHGKEKVVIVDSEIVEDTFIYNFFTDSSPHHCGPMRKIFYANGDLYYTDLINRDTREYGFYRNEELLFSDTVGFAVSGHIFNFQIIADKPVFLYFKEKEGAVKLENELTPITVATWFEGNDEISKLNPQEKSISKVFEFNGKIGMLILEDGQWYVVYDSKKITRNYDTIAVKGCCSYLSYPFSIDKNGILFFMAKDKDNFYFVEIDLKEF